MLCDTNPCSLGAMAGHSWPIVDALGIGLASDGQAVTSERTKTNVQCSVIEDICVCHGTPLCHGALLS